MSGPGIVFVSYVAVAFLSGCAVNLPFNHRLAYTSVRDAKQMQSVTASGDRPQMGTRDVSGEHQL